MSNIEMKDLWLPLIGIGVQIAIAIGSFVVTKFQLTNNDRKTRLNDLSVILDNLRTKSCEYWGRTSMTPEYQQLLECGVKSALDDIKLSLKGLYDKFKSLRSEIHKLQTETYVEINKIITGDHLKPKRE